MAQDSSFLNPDIALSPEKEKQILCDQYKLFVDAFQKLTERRGNINNFYVAINSVIISTLAGLSEGSIFPTKNVTLSSILLIIGIGSIVSWIQIVRVYYTANFKSYQMIREFEKYLPARVFTVWYDDIAKNEPALPGKAQKNTFVLRREALVPYCFLFAYSLYVAIELMNYFHIRPFS